jgi:adenylate kinase family enzyme
VSRTQRFSVVAIDGGASAGKSTLATALADRLTDVAVLHTDDLLDGWAGQFEYWTRLREQVLGPLAAGHPGRYQRYDWISGRFAEWVDVPVVKTLIVEGVSAIEACGDQLSVGILLDVPRAIRQQRWIARDGAMRPEWITWLDNEDAYFAAHPPAAGVLVLPSGYGADEQTDG